MSDWNLFFAVANVNVLVANPQAGFRDFAQAYEALKTRGQGSASPPPASPRPGTT